MTREEIVKQVIEEGPEVYFREYYHEEPRDDETSDLVTMTRFCGLGLLDLTSVLFGEFDQTPEQVILKHMDMMTCMEQLNKSVDMFMNYPDIVKLYEMKSPVTDPGILLNASISIGSCARAIMLGPLDDTYTVWKRDYFSGYMPSTVHIPMHIEKMNQTYEKLQQLLEV